MPLERATLPQDGRKTATLSPTLGNDVANTSGTDSATSLVLDLAVPERVARAALCRLIREHGWERDAADVVLLARWEARRG